MKKENLYLVVAVVLVIVFAIILPKGSDTNPAIKSGGGINLKDANKKDSTSTEMKVFLEGGVTTNEVLYQGLMSANHYMFYGDGSYIGAVIVGGVSNKYGVMAPTIYVVGMKNFHNFGLEYRVGKFKRTSIMSSGFDPMYANHCLDLGEGGAAANVMQLSFVKGAARFGFGHQGAESFYDFSGGSWYAYMEALLCKYVSLAGGVDVYENAPTTGYFATKLNINNYSLSVSGNKLGGDNQSFIATVNRNNLMVKGNKISLALSSWFNRLEQGIHFSAGLLKGKATYFVMVGSDFVSTLPYVGLSTRYTF